MGRDTPTQGGLCGTGNKFFDTWRRTGRGVGEERVSQVNWIRTACFCPSHVTITVSLSLSVVRGQNDSLKYRTGELANCVVFQPRRQGNDTHRKRDSEIIDGNTEVKRNNISGVTYICILDFESIGCVFSISMVEIHDSIFASKEIILDNNVSPELSDIRVS